MEVIIGTRQQYLSIANKSTSFPAVPDMVLMPVGVAEKMVCDLGLSAGEPEAVQEPNGTKGHLHIYENEMQ